MRDTFSFLRLTWMVAVALVGMLLYSSWSFAQKDEYGKPDTCRIIVFQNEKSNQVMASVSIFNDEKLAAMTIPFRYGNGKSPIKCDSVRFRKTRVEDFDMKNQLIDTVLQTVLLGLISDMSGSKEPLSKGNGEVAKIYLTLRKDQKFQDFLLDTTWVRPFNVLKFVTPDVKSVFPVFDNSRAWIRGGIPITPPIEKKSETPSQEEKGKEVEKSPAPADTGKK